MTRDYYGTLDLLPSASADMIRVAYRTKAKELHPDRGADADEMALVNEAYEVLRDPGRRAEYDRMRRVSEEPEGDPGPPLEDDLWGEEADFEPEDSWGDEADWDDVVEDEASPPDPGWPAETPLYPWETGSPPPPPAAPVTPAVVLTEWRPQWPKLPKGDPRARPARAMTWISATITVAICLLPMADGLIRGEGPRLGSVLFYLVLTALAFRCAKNRVAGLTFFTGGYGVYVLCLVAVTLLVASSSVLAAAMTLVWTVPFLVMVELRCRYFRSHGIR